MTPLPSRAEQAAMIVELNRAHAAIRAQPTPALAKARRRGPCVTPWTRPGDPAKRSALERRRGLARSGTAMPIAIARRLRECATAAAAIIAREVRDHGYCDLDQSAIAAQAGMATRTVRKAIADLRQLGLIHVRARKTPDGRRNLTNVITIVDQRWLAFLNPRFKRSGGISGGSTPGGTKMPTTQIPLSLALTAAEVPPRPPAHSLAHPANKRQRAKR